VQEVKGEFDAAGVTIVVISFAEPSLLLAYQRLQQWPFVLLSDPAREAYRCFGLERLRVHRLFSLSTLRLYASLLWKGRKLQNYGPDDYYQGGGDFLVRRDGTLLFAHRSRTPADRPSVSTLLEAIRKAKG
jgi:hypothetical protein